jgi:hypothetical protein
MTGLTRAAIHEASHCVVALALGDRRVSRIVLHDTGGGLTTILTRRGCRDPKKDAAVCLAGPIGEMLRTGSTLLDGQIADLDNAVAILRTAGIAPDDALDVLDEIFAVTVALIERHCQLIDAVARALVRSGRLDEPQIMQIFRGHV